jgi:hypothetical protein
MDALDLARTRYDNEGKAVARAVPMRWLERRVPTKGRYLDLFGGGLSAELAVSTRPDVDVVSAEVDPALHAALTAHSEQWSYTPHLGDFRDAGGLFDLIFLDLTGNASERSVQMVKDARSMLRSDGALFVTISPDHEGDWAVQLNRPITVAALLAEVTRLNVIGLMVYSNRKGKTMVLVALYGAGTKLFTSSRVVEMIERRGFWAGRHDGGMAWLFGPKHRRRRAEEATRQRDREKAREYLASSPDRREKNRILSRERYYAKREEVLARMRTPEYREAVRLRERARRVAARVFRKFRCGVCRTSFLHHRSDVKYCSDPCRREAQRCSQREYDKRTRARVRAA